MNNSMKNCIIIGLTMILIILLYDNLSKREIIKNKETEIKNLNIKIKEFEINETQLKDDKLFYKNLYIELANEYNTRLHSLGIDEWIFTDTSR